MNNRIGYVIAGVLALFIAVTILYCTIAAGVVGLFGYFVIVGAGIFAYSKVKSAVQSMKGN